MPSGQSFPELRGNVVGFVVVERRVDARLLLQPRDLVRAAGAAHHPAAVELCDLCHDGPDRAGCRGDEHGVAVFHGGDFRETNVGRHARQAEHTEIGAGGSLIRIDADDAFPVGDPVVAPSGVAENPGAFREIPVLRFGDFPDAAAFHRLAQSEGWHVAFRVLHPPPHVGIDGQPLVFNGELPVPDLAYVYLRGLEISLGWHSLGTFLQLDLFAPHENQAAGARAESKRQWVRGHVPGDLWKWTSRRRGGRQLQSARSQDGWPSRNRKAPSRRDISKP